ncbi:uncharacterized protein LOC110956902 [Acanthochromis polyacanthus]|uniref:uncharacterized protein LOC110956902 n=1 Tax=Acanthochromis polyacanthus TaxID=80966 RepID=UPI0022342708|nr:uncharacterized protein LOC110956902 [Acanthochromis polyacanthus]
MDRAEDQISLPEQVKPLCGDSWTLPGEGGEEEGRLEKKVVDLTAKNQQLLEEQRAERRRSKEEALQWHREKSKMLEVFSNRLDVPAQPPGLHFAGAGDGQTGNRESPRNVDGVNTGQQEAAEEGEGSEEKGLSAEQQTAACTDPDRPLEGAKARLEELKESLYQREREITELLEAERSPFLRSFSPPAAFCFPLSFTRLMQFADQCLKPKPF